MLEKGSFEAAALRGKEAFIVVTKMQDSLATEVLQEASVLQDSLITF